MAEFDTAIIEDATGGAISTDSTPGEGTDTAEPTLAEHLAALETRFQKQLDKRLRSIEQDHPAELRRLAEEQGTIKRYLSEVDADIQRHAPAIERYLADLDPETLRQMKAEADVKTTAQLVKSLARDQAEAKAPQKSGPNAWTEQARSVWEAFEPDLIEHVEGLNLDYEQVYNEIMAKKLFPAPMAGETPSERVRGMVQVAKAYATQKASDLKKRSAASVKAGADTSGGGAAKGTWAQAMKLAEAGDTRADALIASLLAAEKR